MAELLAIEGQTVIRVLCGLFFVPHTIAKLRNIELASQFFAKAGFHPPRMFVVLTAGLEILASIGLIFGIFLQLAGLTAAIILFVAAGAVMKINGFNWRWQHQGIEYMLFWGMICLAVVFLF